MAASGFTSEQFSLRREWLYHLTSRANLAFVQARWMLYSSSKLAEMAGCCLIPARRKQDLKLHVGNQTILIRDQKPLREANLEFENGWDMTRFVGLLNGLVFFWAGNAAQPTLGGRNHYKKYAAEGPVILRFACAELFACNEKNSPKFCKYNSGAPTRQHRPCCANTFVAADDAHFETGDVQEVVFGGEVVLPEKIQIGDSFSGEWATLRKP